MRWFQKDCLVCEQGMGVHAVTCMYAAKKIDALQTFKVNVEWFPLAPPPPKEPPPSTGFFAAVLAFFGVGVGAPSLPSLSRRGFLRGVAAVAAVGLLARKAVEKVSPEAAEYFDKPLAYLNQADGLKLVQLHVEGFITRDIM